MKATLPIIAAISAIAFAAPVTELPVEELFAGDCLLNGSRQHSLNEKSSTTNHLLQEHASCTNNLGRWGYAVEALMLW